MTKKTPKDKFFEKQEAALTFDDVLVKPGYSEVLPNHVNIESKFSKNTPLKIPFVSAAMDTVTEYKMAIALALLGGIGVIHKNMSPGEQLFQISKVKYHMHAIIKNPKPISVHENSTMEQILQMKEKKKYDFNTFPVHDNSGKLVGMLSSTEFLFYEKELSAVVRDIMAKEPITAGTKTTIEQAYNLMKIHKKKVLPLVNKNGILQAMYTLKDLKRIIEKTSPYNNVDEKGQLIVAASVGVGEDAIHRVELLQTKTNLIVIGTAHGDSKKVYDTLKEIKKTYSGLEVVVGNVVEPEAVKKLAQAGADGILVGVGPGSICSTRIIAGIGRPQITAVYECAKEAYKYGIPVCADGGIINSGDVVKAIAAGASSVMMGNILAGTQESPGDTITREGKKMKYYRGMGSIAAMKDNSGSRERYSQEDSGKNPLIAEGVESLISYRGSLSEVMEQFTGGLRSGMGYAGAKDIQELRKKSTFERITSAGIKESHPHDVLIINEPSNYSQRKQN